MEQNVVSEKKKLHISAPAVMLIIAAIALLIGFIAPPVIRKNENNRISQDCKTASNILAAAETALKDSNVSQQVKLQLDMRRLHGQPLVVQELSPAQIILQICSQR